MVVFFVLYGIVKDYQKRKKLKIQRAALIEKFNGNIIGFVDTGRVFVMWGRDDLLVFISLLYITYIIANLYETGGTPVDIRQLH